MMEKQVWHRGCFSPLLFLFSSSDKCESSLWPWLSQMRNINIRYVSWVWLYVLEAVNIFSHGEAILPSPTLMCLFFNPLLGLLIHRERFDPSMRIRISFCLSRFEHLPDFWQEVGASRLLRLLPAGFGWTWACRAVCSPQGAHARWRFLGLLPASGQREGISALLPEKTSRSPPWSLESYFIACLNCRRRKTG